MRQGPRQGRAPGRRGPAASCSISSDPNRTELSAFALRTIRVRRRLPRGELFHTRSWRARMGPLVAEDRRDLRRRRGCSLFLFADHHPLLTPGRLWRVAVPHARTRRSRVVAHSVARAESCPTSLTISLTTIRWCSPAPAMAIARRHHGTISPPPPRPSRSREDPDVGRSTAASSRAGLPGRGMLGRGPTVGTWSSATSGSHRDARSEHRQPLPFRLVPAHITIAVGAGSLLSTLPLFSLSKQAFIADLPSAPPGW